jgi:hypothetical protein
MFSGHVELVAATKIFARGLPDGRQALIYSMDVETRHPVAMVLPLPVPPNGPDDAVQFVDLEGYADLFTDLHASFPDLSFSTQSLGRGEASMDLGVEKLIVHQVGAFEASFVPNPRDFKRLDRRFQLPPNVLAALPQYDDWGFAVFQLAKGKRQTIHPMAMRFPRRDGALFFPTVHVHDGTVPDVASFEHQFYAQLDPVTARIAEWTPSIGPLRRTVDTDRTHDLIDGRADGSTLMLWGSLPNRDLVLTPPPVTLADLDGRGDSHAYRVRATYHHSLDTHHLYPRWRDVMRAKLPQLCAGLRTELPKLLATNERAWQLGPLTDDLAPHFMNGQQLWTGTDYMHGKPGMRQGPGKIAFTPFGDLVELQAITLGFRELPEPADAQRINRALCQFLDRLVA